MAKILNNRAISCGFGHAVVAFFIIAIACMGLLSMMRSDSQELDGSIAQIQARIDACEKETRELERACAAMMSPKAVHAYASKQLGMSRVRLAGTVRLDGAISTNGTATASLVGSRIY